MASEHPIRIQLCIDRSQPELLTGLEIWLRMGLLSEAEVRKLCREQLTCPLPEPTPQPVAAMSMVVESESAQQTNKESTIAAESVARSDFLIQLLQSLMTELSVRWLLFLSVFMVVVSSGVLAATQWQNFTPVGQYSILLGYTLAFWGASLWISRSSHLHLTAQMLQITTLLIIPVNFWMMDGLYLFRSGIGWFVAAIAGLILTGILWLLTRTTSKASALPTPWLTLTSIGLSWLHWGWNWSIYPWIATYIGTIATATALFYHDQVWHLQPQSSAASTSADQAEAASWQSWMTPAVLAVLGASLLLLFRAILIRQIPLRDLGLALGICGSVFAWLSRRASARPVWLVIGIALLVIGRFVSLDAATPWQALAISALGLGILGDRLHRNWQTWELVSLFLTGLQALWPLRRVLPESIRQQIVATCIQLTGLAGMPTALWGVTIFPYVLLTLYGAIQLRRRQKPELAKQAEWLALLLGVSLTVMSIENPLLRSLNLALSALTLIAIVRRRSQAGKFLVYLTHITSLAAITLWIQFGFPQLSFNQWAVVLLIGALAEWSYCSFSQTSNWQQSAWYLGLALASISYLLLLAAEQRWGWIWLVVPVMLTGLSTHETFPRSRLAAGFSSGALILAQVLTFSAVMPRLLALALATGLMLSNTVRVRQLGTAALTLGFGLTFAFCAMLELLQENFRAEHFFNGLAIATFVLWLLRSRLQQQATVLKQLYVQATEGWAILLQGANLGLLTLYLLVAWVAGTFITTYPPLLTTAAVISALAVGYRIWQHPHELGFYGLAWSVELGIVSLLLPQRSLGYLAIANLVLAFTTQLLGDWTASRTQQRYRVSWHLIPLVYAVLSWLLQHNHFTATTGLYTLAAALVGIGVGRRTPKLLPLSYLAWIGISVGAYELLIYQLLQQQGGRVGEGLVALAALGTGLAIAERLLARKVTPYYLRIPEPGLQVVSHLHWVVSNVFLLLALIAGPSSIGELGWIGVAAILAIYAIWQGRLNPFWIYFGYWEAMIAIAYWLFLQVPGGILLPWGGVMAAVVAWGIHQLPWVRWGWSAHPWQQCSLVLPLIVLGITLREATITTVLVIAAFYAWLAQVQRRIRISYLGVLIANWGIWRLLQLYQLTGAMALAAFVGGSLLYIVQVDPALRSSNERETRHWVRILAISLICLVALYESDGKFFWGVFAAGLCLLTAIAGLCLQVRAYLYVGTVAFMLKVLRQLWLFVTDYSLLLWAIGIVLGLLLFAIATTFEARRNQVIALLQYWVDELRAWE